MKQHKILFLKIIVFTIFIARAYQHLFWDAPYRSIIWSETHLRDFIENTLTIPWENWVSVEMDLKIRILVKTIGLLYFLSSISIFYINSKLKKWVTPIYMFTCFWQFILFFCYTKESFFHLGMFLEHAIQIGTPFILYYILKKPISSNTPFISTLLIGITFFCHGLYAMGFYNVPANFVDMTLLILKTDETTAKTFLHIIGIIDLLILLFIFFPKTKNIALIYCFVWGCLTALARIVAYWSNDFILESLHQYTFETVVRLCHGFLPLWVLTYHFKTTYVEHII